MNKSDSEEELSIAKRAQAGDKDAFGELCGRCRENVYGLCLRILRNSADAEDVSQEVFIRLFRNIKQFRGEAKFRTWLYRMTVNEALMSLRKKRIVTVPIENLWHSDKVDASCSVVIQPDLEDERGMGPKGDVGRKNQNLERLYLREALGRLAILAPGYAAVFVLHDVRGYEHREIAEILGCSIGNSKSQLYKARLRLRGLISGNAISPRRAATATAT